MNLVRLELLTAAHGRPCRSAAGSVVRARGSHEAGTFAGGAAAAAPARLSEAAGITGVFGKACLFLSLAIMSIAGGDALAATAPGTPIANTAQVSYSPAAGADPVAESSNGIIHIVEPPPVPPGDPAEIDFLGYDRSGSSPSSPSSPIGPTACFAGGSFSELPDPSAVGVGSLDADGGHSLSPVELYHAGDPVFISVVDTDQNINPTVRDTLEITISVDDPPDSETLRLTESDVDTGVFVGYIQTSQVAASAGDCVLSVSEGSLIEAEYVDESNASQVVAAAALVDPFGVVFDSVTGAPVNGAVVEMIDADTGLPAEVFGDDGVSSYPSTLVTGTGASDSSGATYNFADGFYRFPFVAPGNYQLRVTTPDGYVWTSNVAPGDLPPGFAIELGSYGEVFVVNPGPALHIDIPVDPIGSDIFVQKIAQTQVAGIGDFIEYQIQVSNPSPQPSPGTTAVDTLPVGFRYMTGSTRIDGVAAPDPDIAPDGRTLSWDLGLLAAGASTDIRYVVEVGAGAGTGAAENVVEVIAGGAVISNEGSATVLIRDDLMQDRSLLAGRVVLGSCDDEVANDTAGVGGVRIYLEDGRYIVTGPDGRWHMEGVQPGTHVVQLDLDSIPDHLEIERCERNTRFAGRSYSQFVDLAPGQLWRADFYLKEKPTPSGSLSVGLTGELADDTLSLSLPIQGGPLAMHGVNLNVVLPEGLSYVADSARLDGEPVALNPLAPGLYVLALGDTDGDWARTLTLDATVDSEAGGELTIKAMAAFKDPTGKAQRTQVAELPLVVGDDGVATEGFTHQTRFDSRRYELSDADRDAILARVAEVDVGDISRIEVVGHTDDVPVVEIQGRAFSDNQELSWLRARSVARAIAEELGLPPSQVTVRGAGDAEPVADNNTGVGRAANRRVEVSLWTGSAGETTLGEVGGAVTARFETPHHVKQKVEKLSQDELRAIPIELTPAYLESLTPGRGFLYPTATHNLPVASTIVYLQHRPGDQLKVYINGEQVPAIARDKVKTNAKGTVAVTAWRGVKFQEGPNTLTAEVTAADGSTDTVTETVHLADVPVRVEYLASRSVLAADGRTVPTIAVKLYDRYGHPARPGQIGEFTVEPPYRALQEAERAQRANAVLNRAESLTFITDRDGVAHIELEPTTDTGEVRLHIGIGDRRDELVRARLLPGERDWILVGLAEGTVGHSSVSGNLQALTDADEEADYYQDGRVAFFAKGKVKGEYLLTVAYDTDKERAEDPSRLLGQVDPDGYYTVYGDGTQQRFEAASQEKLYLKIEKGTFYALFGDYSTGLNYTELSSYSRRFNGIKSEYQGERFGYTAFAAESNQAFIKDEIQGDGTSGLYHLSRSPIIINSERVVLETRDRFQGDEVVSTQVLQRYLDYDIDYLLGTIFFKRPVPSRDAEFNPVFIVVDYETDGTGDEELIAGGRAAMTLADDKVELGMTMVHEGGRNVGGDLRGVDVTYRVNDETEVRAEVATSSSERAGLARSGNGFTAEVVHHGENLDGRAYVGDVEAGFGLGQQTGAATGNRKIGAEARYHVNEELDIEGQAYVMESEQSGNRRRVAEFGARYRGDGYSLGGGVRHARDELAGGTENGSDQIYASASKDVLDGKLKLSATTEQSYNANGGSADFPDRSTLGAAYKLTDNADLFLEQEWADGRGFDSQLTRMGIRMRPWTGGNLQSSMDRSYNENGSRLMANFGLTQNLPVGERWTLDFGLDRAQTLSYAPRAAIDPDVPPASGDLREDYAAVFFGANYAHDDWQVSNRVEWRDGDTSDRLGLFSGLFRELSDGRALSASLQVFDTGSTIGADTFAANLTLGMAWRPSGSRWMVFDRADLIYDKSEGVGSDRKTWRIVNSLHANYMFDRRTQLTLQYGAKYVRSNFDGFDAKGFTDLIGVGLRRDLSEKWDIGGDLSVLHSWNTDTMKYRAGASVGYNLAENMWLSLGYNLSGFEDRDFSQADYTAQGPFITFRIKFDQDSARRFLTRSRLQEPEMAGGENDGS